MNISGTPHVRGLVQQKPQNIKDNLKNYDKSEFQFDVTVNIVTSSGTYVIDYTKRSNETKTDCDKLRSFFRVILVKKIRILPFFSFCPDPCCPQKHLTKKEFCWDNEKNPCFHENPAGRRECGLIREENKEFR